MENSVHSFADLADDETNSSDLFPLYRNWTNELVLIRQRPMVTAEDRFEVEKSMFSLYREFLREAQRGVALILQGRVSPVRNLIVYGNGGDKYVIGGLLFRKAWNWEALNTNIGEGDSAFKAASLELDALQFLEGSMIRQIYFACK